MKCRSILCVFPEFLFTFFGLPPFSLSSLLISHTGSQYCFLMFCLPHLHFAEEYAAFPPPVPSIFCTFRHSLILQQICTVDLQSLVSPLSGLIVQPLLFLSVSQETEKVVLQSNALGFINIPCLGLYFYSAQCLGKTLVLLWMLHWEWEAIVRCINSDWSLS